MYLTYKQKVWAQVEHANVVQPLLHLPLFCCYAQKQSSAHSGNGCVSHAFLGDLLYELACGNPQLAHAVPATLTVDPWHAHAVPATLTIDPWHAHAAPATLNVDPWHAHAAPP